MFSKHVLGPLVILVTRLMPVFLSMPQRGDLCPHYAISGSDHAIVLHINYTSGREHCCRAKQCNAGTEVQYCSANNPNDTACVPCRQGFYNADNQVSYNNPRCLPWMNCSAKLGLVSNNDGTAIHKGTCRCDIKRGFYKSKWPGQCNQKKDPCETNHELDEVTGRCIACRPGYEQLTVGYGPCTACPVNMVKLNGHFNCTRCPPGTYKPIEGYGICQTCESLLEAGQYEFECTKSVPPTPKIAEVKPGNDSTTSDNTVLIAVLSVLGFLLVVVIIVATLAYLQRRRRIQRERRMKISSSPLRNGTTPGGPYRAVSENSTTSDSSSNGSSAEEALEVEKLKAQIDENLKAANPDNNSNNTKDDLGTDYASPTGPPTSQQLPSGVQPAQMTGMPAGYAYQPEQGGGFLIVNPRNCNISLGPQNSLNMKDSGSDSPATGGAPVHPPQFYGAPQGGMVNMPHPTAAPPRSESPQLNNLNQPRSRQSAPPTLDRSTNLGGGAPVDFVPERHYTDGEPHYYEDDADRIAAFYESRT